MTFSLALLLAGIVVMALFRTVVLAFLAALVGVSVVGLFRRGQRAAGATVLGVMAAAVAVAVAMDPRGRNDDLRIIRERLWDHLGMTLHEAFTVNLPDLFTGGLGELAIGLDLGAIGATAASGIVLLMLALGVRRRLLWVLTGAMVLAMPLLFLVTPRYLLPVLPFVVWGWYESATWNAFRPGWRWGTLWVVVYLACNGVRIGDTLGEQWGLRPYPDAPVPRAVTGPSDAG